jgi:PPOX class probable F420-dependent enzyme
MPTLTPDEAWRRLTAARVAYLATVRPDGRPHIVPIVFAAETDGDVHTIYSIADPKPKTGLDLLRHRNIAANPTVSVLADAYDEAWEQLWWVRADGLGRVVEHGPDRDLTLRLLLAKYPQYTTWATPFGAATVITVDDLTSWTI